MVNKINIKRCEIKKMDKMFKATNIALNKDQFAVLSFMEKNRELTFEQHDISEKTGLTLEQVQVLLSEMVQEGFITNDKITAIGLEALEPYRVKNAIIMAAGMSSRFAPLSYEKPKGLLKVKGEILIEREIEQLHEAGITDITVVVGYMKQKFFYLEEKYNVKIVVNEDYYRYNNTSTLIRVKEQLSNTYICSSDNYFVDNVFEKYVYQSYYAAVYADGDTEEYCMTTDANGRITNVTIGGKDAWYMLGHVYFSKEFSDKFKAILENDYDSMQTKEQLWERLYMRYIDELDLYIRKYDEDKVKEFDSLDELRDFDERYVNNTDSKIFTNINKVMNCTDKDITDIKAIKSGMTNTSFVFSLYGKKYVYRHPGVGTENYIDRRSEQISQQAAKKLELDQTFIYMDEKEGWKISHYIENARTLDYHNQDEVKTALEMMRTLHDAKIKSDFSFDIWRKTRDFIKKVDEHGAFDDFKQLDEKMHTLYQYTLDDKVEKCLCHCDCYDPNFLIDESDHMYLIDWEYSGNDDPANDLGTFICCSDYTDEEALDIIRIYLQHEPTNEELRHYLAYVSIASFYWFAWALYQDSVGKTVGEYLYIWYKCAKSYADKALALYENA